MSVVLLLTATAMLCALQHMALKLPLLAPAAEARSVGYSWYLSPPLLSAQLSSCRISWQRRIGVQRGVRLAGVRVGDAACRRRAAAGPAGACVAIALLLAARDADHHPASKLPRTSGRWPSGCSVLLSRQPTNQPTASNLHALAQGHLSGIASGYLLAFGLFQWFSDTLFLHSIPWYGRLECRE